MFSEAAAIRNVLLLHGILKTAERGCSVSHANESSRETVEKKNAETAREQTPPV